MRLPDLLYESALSVWREARRTAPMAAGIVWGVASVFVLVAVGRGFEATQRQTLQEFGDSFMLLRMNRAPKTRGDVRHNAFVRMDGDDIADIRVGAPSMAAVSPKANTFGSRAYRGSDIAFGSALGVEPGYADIVNVPLAEGRWLNDVDMQQELPVCVLGPGVRESLFGEGPCVGEDIHMIFDRDVKGDSLVRRLTVVGTLKDMELTGDEIYTSHRSAILMPFTTWERMSPRGFQFIVVRPRDDVDRDAALAEVRAVLGRRYGFEASSENSLVPYFDAFERKEHIDAVFGGLRIFLGAVGALILLLGAIGVANVVLMSVAARTNEFGLRRALGCKRRWVFAQVFLEAAAVCVTSGVLGFVLGVAGVGVMGLVDLPAGFAAPRAELGAAWLPGALLLVVSLGAAIWPAWRAARLAPAIALRGAHL